MAGVFISYSRADLPFVQYLTEALHAEKREVWVDLKNIPPSAKWQQEINDAIDSAEVIIFVLSPDSITSEAVANEINRASEDKKRIIPIVCRDVDPQAVSPVLSQLNWIYFRRQDDPSQAMQKLRFALDTDLTYWRQAGDLLAKAREWEARGKNRGFVLRGAALNEAEAWLTKGATMQPSPTPLHVQYITAGRRAVAGRQRTTIGALSVGLIITVVLTILAGYFNFQTQQENKILQARSLAAKANTLLANGQLDQALLVSAFAAQQDPQGIEGRAALNAALDYSPYLEKILDDGSTHNPTYPQSGPAANAPHGRQVIVSQDGKSALFALENGFTVYDLNTLKPKFPFVLTNSQQSLGFSDIMSPDGKVVITDDSSFTMYDAQTGRVIGTLGTNNDDSNGNIQRMAISPDGYYFAASQSGGTNEQIVIWNLATKAIVATIPAPVVDSSSLNTISLTFSADSRMLAIAECADIIATTACGNGAAIEIWSTSAQKVIARHSISASETAPFTIAFTPDENILVTGGSPYNCPSLACTSGQITSYSTSTLTVKKNVQDVDGVINDIAFSPDGNFLFSANGKTTRIWAIHRLSGSLSEPYPYQVVPTYSKFAATSSTSVNSVAPLPNNKEFLTVDDEGKLLLYRLLPFSDEGLSLQDSNVSGDSPVIFTPDGKYIITGTHDGRILYWDLSTHTIVRTLSGGWASGMFDEHDSFAISPDGSLLADGLNSAPYPGGSTEGGTGSGGVLLWNLKAGKLVGSALIPPANSADASEMVINVSFSSDGKYLSETEYDGRVTIWNVQTQTMVHDFWQGYPETDSLTNAISDTFSAPFSPKGDIIALQLSNNTIEFWDVAANKIIQTFSGDQYRITSLDFSPDGSTLLTFDSRNIVREMDLQTGKVISQFTVSSTPLNRTRSGPIGLITFGGAKYAHVKAAFAPVLVVTGSELLMLDPKTLQPTGSPLFNVGDILDSVLSPGGKYVVTATAEGPVTVRLLDIKILTDQVCSIVQRNLNHQEWDDLIGKLFPYEKICPQYPA